jgi:hypothetical protein
VGTFSLETVVLLQIVFHVWNLEHAN